jgi:hypothetical protein
MIVKYNPIPAGMICVCLLTNFDAGCKSKYNLIRNIQSFICLHFHFFINTYYKNKIKIRFWFISVTSPYPPLISVRWNVYIQTEWRNPLIFFSVTRLRDIIKVCKLTPRPKYFYFWHKPRHFFVPVSIKS